jgi:hypothetical protein
MPEAAEQPAPAQPPRIWRPIVFWSATIVATTLLTLAVTMAGLYYFQVRKVLAASSGRNIGRNWGISLTQPVSMGSVIGHGGLPEDAIGVGGAVCDRRGVSELLVCLAVG